MSKVVVFDMDDTLFPEKEFVRSGFKEVDRYLQKKLSINNFFVRAWEKFSSGSRGFIFNQVLHDINYDGDVSILVKELVNVYREHIPSIELFKDAKWALDYYSKMAPLALISDGYFQTQKNKAASLNIDCYFQKYYFSDEWGEKYWKPSTFTFKKAQNDFREFGDDFVYISDNPEKDFIAPNKLGWDSVCIRREFGEYSEVEIPLKGKPRVIISSLFELKDILVL